jgi:hypothetical protein
MRCLAVGVLLRALPPMGACLPMRCLAVGVLLRALPPTGVCLPMRCLAVGVLLRALPPTGVCLPMRCLAVGVLLRALPPMGVCLPSRCLAIRHNVICYPPRDYRRLSKMLLVDTVILPITRRPPPTSSDIREFLPFPLYSDCPRQLTHACRISHIRRLRISNLTY